MILNLFFEGLKNGLAMGSVFALSSSFFNSSSLIGIYTSIKNKTTSGTVLLGTAPLMFDSANSIIR